MTSYKEIFDLALRLYDDNSLAQWPVEDITKELAGHLQTAIYRLPQLGSEISERDEFDLDNMEDKGFRNTLSDTSKIVLALAMKMAWMEPMIDSTTHTLQSFSKREGYSQAEHLKALQSRYDSIGVELKKLLRDTTYINNDYFN